MSSHAVVADKKRDSSAEPRRRSSRPASTGTTAALGGEPRVSLLPNEVHDFHKARRIRRRLTGAALVALIIVGLGISGAFVLSTSSEAALAAARDRTLQLTVEEAEYAELRQVQSGIALVQAGQQVGASTEVDWKTYLQNLAATLPEGVTITTVGIDTASPFVDYPQSSVPLEGSRIATLTFDAVSPTLPSIPTWLDGLATLPGFADATPGSVSSQEGGAYVVNIIMHINSDAFELRFAEEESE